MSTKETGNNTIFTYTPLDISTSPVFEPLPVDGFKAHLKRITTRPNRQTFSQKEKTTPTDPTIAEITTAIQQPNFTRKTRLELLQGVAADIFDRPTFQSNQFTPKRINYLITSLVELGDIQSAGSKLSTLHTFSRGDTEELQYLSYKSVSNMVGLPDNDYKKRRRKNIAVPAVGMAIAGTVVLSACTSVERPPAIVEELMAPESTETTIEVPAQTLIELPAPEVRVHRPTPVMEGEENIQEEMNGVGGPVQSGSQSTEMPFSEENWVPKQEKPVDVFNDPFFRYKVQPGDTLWDIATNHGVSLNALLEAMEEVVGHREANRLPTEAVLIIKEQPVRTPFIGLRIPGKFEVGGNAVFVAPAWETCDESQCFWKGTDNVDSFAIPGFPSVIFLHRNTSLGSTLSSLEPGEPIFFYKSRQPFDEIDLLSEDAGFAGRVDLEVLRKEVIEDEQIFERVLDKTEDNIFAIVSCHPPGDPLAPQRLVVWLELVE